MSHFFDSHNTQTVNASIQLDIDSEAEIDPKLDDATERARLEESSNAKPTNSRYACDDTNGSKSNLNADITDQVGVQVFKWKFCY